ncbi:MAG TPA: hypothetical protein VGG74_31290 [Kofleriaceae bacterium]|jgi:hypothetical protein
MLRVLVLATLAACHPYVKGGYDVSSTVSGPMSTLMGESMATARTLPGTAAIAATPASPAHNYSLAFGFGSKDFGAEIGLQEYGATTSAFDTGDSAQRYVTTTGSINVRWTMLRWKYFSGFVHAGPSVGALVDKGAQSTAFGEGVRYGGGIAITFPVVILYLDASRTALQMIDGDAKGFNQLGGITVGLGIH